METDSSQIKEGSQAAVAAATANEALLHIQPHCLLMLRPELQAAAAACPSRRLQAFSMKESQFQGFSAAAALQNGPCWWGWGWWGLGAFFELLPNRIRGRGGTKGLGRPPGLFTILRVTLTRPQPPHPPHPPIADGAGCQSSISRSLATGPRDAIPPRRHSDDERLLGWF